VVALTFDAGANDDAVTSILATLQGAHVPATFFLTGSFVSRFAAIARRIAAAGGGAVMFGAHPASQLAGFAVSVVLATAEMFAIGLLIAAIAPSASVAGVAGTVLLYPMLFFAGPVGASAEPVAAAQAQLRAAGPAGPGTPAHSRDLCRAGGRVRCRHHDCLAVCAGGGSLAGRPRAQAGRGA